MPYKYMRVCPVCQWPAVKHLSSHLSMVHSLNGHERTPHLKNAVLYSYEPVLLKERFSSKTMFYSVQEDWLLCTCPVYKQQIQRK